MGLGVSELLLILVIVIVIFGTKKLRSIGGDLGGAIRSFKQAMNENDDKALPHTADNSVPPEKVADTVDNRS
ncbi:MAG: twin-arginine translocase TatA/TatE family subunit [Methylomonas sp.]|nr:twin-arginine translocase TatA/TatE family subunit [Methylomonas sp.]PPD24759.1 MAG: twin-arginine translocase TatA/TatE family subunit [Methylomonas sp.]PPD33361.1 MAG: twin-arginine translocase TatA/TatE family subunit [Methylomonas sp.]